MDLIKSAINSNAEKKEQTNKMSDKSYGYLQTDGIITLPTTINTISTSIIFDILPNNTLMLESYANIVTSLNQDKILKNMECPQK